MPDANQFQPDEIAGTTGRAARIGLWLGPLLAIVSLLPPISGLAWEARLKPLVREALRRL